MRWGPRPWVAPQFKVWAPFAQQSNARGYKRSTSGNFVLRPLARTVVIPHLNASLRRSARIIGFDGRQCPLRRPFYL